LILFPLTAKAGEIELAMRGWAARRSNGCRRSTRNDRQKLNEEMMKFYRRTRSNPLAGCSASRRAASRLLRGCTGRSVALQIRSACVRPVRNAFCGTRKRQGVREAGVAHLKVLTMTCRSKAATQVHGLGKALPYYTRRVGHLHGYLPSPVQTSRNQPAGGNPQMAMIGKDHAGVSSE